MDVYERDGKYQLYASEIELSGRGDLYLRFEKLLKELEEMGLAAPQITYIMHALKEKGLDVDVTATTVDEAKENILAVLRKCNPGKLSGDKQSVSDSQSKKENAKAETLISEMEADLTEDGTKESHSDAPDEDLSVQKETMDKKSAEQEENEGGQEV